MKPGSSDERTHDRIRARVDAWLVHPMVELAIVILIIASVGLLVVEAIYEDEQPWAIWIGDAITWLFVVEIAARFWVARKKRRFFRRYWIDILAVLPVLRPFRFFRVFRLLRLFRAGTFLSRRVSLFRGVLQGAVGELTFLGTLTSVLVVAATAILYFVESGNGVFKNAADTMWFAVYSLVAGEPVGGDPKSTLGRAITLVLMFGGLTIFGMFVGTISASMVARISKRTDMQDLDLEEHTQHVVICGWNGSGPSVLVELFGSKGQDTAVVLITEAEQLPSDIPALVRRELLYHVSGDYTKLEVLERANIREAAAAILLSDTLTPRSDQDRDARTVLAAMTIERIAPKVFTCAELRNRDNDSLLKMVGVDEIVVPEEYSGVLLGSVSRNRGLVRVLDEILSARYGNAFHKVTIPPAWVGRTTRELFGTLKEQHDALLVSLEIPGEGKRREAIVNPPLDQVLVPDSIVVVISPHPVVL